MQPEIHEALKDIKHEWRARRFCIKAQSKIDRSLESYVRYNFTDYGLEGQTDSQREAENKKALALIAKAEGGEGDLALVALVVASREAREPFDKVRRQHEKAIAKIAATLPIVATFKVRGFGIASLGAIVGEAGDLSKYPTAGHLWKRMGLALVDGKRQGAPGKNASAGDWIAHGYNAQRRSVVWNIGDALIKQNKDRYRETYDRRKAYEIARDPEIKPIVAHARAKRYMEKRLLKDLWRAWRRAVDVVPQHEAISLLSAAPSIAA